LEEILGNPASVALGTEIFAKFGYCPGPVFRA
jgi:hypothetical protein